MFKLLETATFEELAQIILEIFTNELSLQGTFKQIVMKKLILLLFAGMMLCPSVMEAKHYKSKIRPDTGQPPIRMPAASYVGVDLDETTGLLTLYFVGNVGNLQITISQNTTTIESDYVSTTNGGTMSYDLSGYAVGDYLLTLETDDGTVTQYILSVEDD